ncbi:hypothetical protein [Nostoc sp.]|uniref:hypothetical protein n=1 Tax=Nostoc sp. TaxID=1180 RepID=UPI002FF87A66
MEWIIINTVNCFLGFLLWLILGVLIDKVQLKPNLAFYLILFFLPGVVIGLSQWLLLLEKIPTISWLWILSNVPGLYLAFISTVVACFFILTSEFIGKFLQVTDGLTQTFLIASIGGAIGGAVGGIITGIIQHLLIRKNFSVNRLWIITSIVGWSVSWSLGWTVALIIGFHSPIFNAIFKAVRYFSGISSDSNFGLGLPLPFFGIIFGFVNAIITGKVLVRLLRQSKQTHS